MIKKITTYVSVALILLLWLPQPVSAGGAGVLVVKVNDGGESLSGIGDAELLFEGVYRLKVSDQESAMTFLSGDPSVEFVHPDVPVRTERVPVDPIYTSDEALLGQQWYLPKIQAEEAWDKTTGSRDVVVAVIDTGINARHEDLNDGRVIAGHLNYCQVVNPNSSNECLVRVAGAIAPGVNSDDNGHGTIVAGLIGAIGNNNRGIAGVNWQVSLMPVKTLDSSGSGFASDVASGIRWAADNGARIINLSIGGPGLPGVEVLQEAIFYAYGKNVLVVAASGNDAAITGGNLNQDMVFPVCADGGQNMVVGVSATDAEDKKTRFSNYGSDCVDISAPGAGIFIDRQTKQGLVSTYYDPLRPGENDLYVYAVGTSVAAPLVSGVAALVLDASPQIKVAELRARLLNNADGIDQLNLTECGGGSCAGQIGTGRLNAARTVSDSAAFETSSLVRDELGNVYLVEGGVKRSVSPYVLQQRFSGVAVRPVQNRDISAFSNGPAVPPADGSVIKEPGSPTVYLVEGGLLRPMSLLAFVSRDFRFEQVAIIPAAEIIKYGAGPEAVTLDGALVKSHTNSAVYAVIGGRKQLLSFFVFKQRMFDQRPIARIDQQELDQILNTPGEFLYPPKDGTLLRSDLDPTVYLTLSGILRPINLNAFQNRGLNFADVQVVSREEISRFERGAAIVE